MSGLLLAFLCVACGSPDLVGPTVADERTDSVDGGSAPADDSPESSGDSDTLPGLTITPEVAQLVVGDTQSLTVRSGASDVSATWLSSDTSVASVDGQGVVTAAGRGLATISATSDGRTTTATIHVDLQLTFVEDFESDPFDRWPSLDFCCDHSAGIVESPVRSGSGALRVETRFSDPLVAGGRGRSELSTLTLPAPNDRETEMGGLGDEVWFGFSVYIPADWRTDSEPELIQQVKAQPDPGTEEEHGYWKSPVFSIEIDGDAWKVWSRHDPSAVTPSWGNQQLFEGGEVHFGQWTDWVVRARWSDGDDGRLEVWRVEGGEATQVVDHTGGTAFNDERDLYFKIGIYKWPWNQGPTTVDRRVLYYDSVRIVKNGGSFGDVAPR